MYDMSILIITALIALYDKFDIPFIGALDIHNPVGSQLHNTNLYGSVT